MFEKEKAMASKKHHLLLKNISKASEDIIREIDKDLEHLYDTKLDLFSDAGNIDFCTNIEQELVDWESYANGYYNAANILVEKFLSRDKDFYLTRCNLENYEDIDYPIFFLYRHYLEIKLKDLCQKFNKTLDLQDDIRLTHELKPLFKLLYKKYIALSNRKSIVQADTASIIKQFKWLYKPIIQFDSFDKKSMKFRYPTDRNFQLHFDSSHRINIKIFQEAMEHLYYFFISLDNFARVQ